MKDKKRDISGVAKEVSVSVLKYGQEIATSCDPLAAAITLGGKVGVGLAISKFSAGQCAGLIGLIISTITPQVIPTIEYT